MGQPRGVVRDGGVVHNEPRYNHFPDLGRRMILLRLFVMGYLCLVTYILIISFEANIENVVIFGGFISILGLCLFK